MKNYLYYKAINWNEIEDELDNATWERTTSLFWLDTRIPVNEDRLKWEQLSDVEKQQLNKALVVLANLSTYQSIEAGEVIRNSERSQQEIAIFNNIQFTEMVNTKAYNRVLLAFNQDSERLENLFNWVDRNNVLTHRLAVVDEIYHSTNAMQKRFMVLCVEGIMVYNQLAYLLHLWTDKGFTNIGEVLKMVIANESLHCFYATHKLKVMLNEISEEGRETFAEWAVNKIRALIQTEATIAMDMFLEEDVRLLSLNLVFQEANHVAAILGVEPMFNIDGPILAKINGVLGILRTHDLTIPSNKRQKVVEDVMSDDDYDF